ncbi:MAG: 50S ribosomal protein L9 [Bacteroidales bacterium]|nr:50S ribosomal protein L9 [Bacteroidales bacterium]
MEIILKQDVENLGHRDEIVNVKPGYGRNYLIPQGYAILATETAKKIHAENMKQRAHKEAKLREEAEALAAKMQGIELTIATKTSSTGKIFGSINTIMLAEALANKGFEIDRKNIILKDKAIKEVGQYSASIRLYKNIKVNVDFTVVNEE